MLFNPLVDLPDQVVNLPHDRPDFNRWIQQPGRPDDLLYHLVGLGFFVRARRGGHVNDLVNVRFKFPQGQRPVIQGRGQAKTVVDQLLLAGLVPIVHPPHLRHCLVGFVDDQ